MIIDVIDFTIKTTKTKIGDVLVKYYDLVLKCELVYYVKQKKVWIRMPEKWITRETKTPFCYWLSKDISDQFQKEILKKIFDKYDLNVDKISFLHSEASKKRRQSKK